MCLPEIHTQARLFCVFVCSGRKDPHSRALSLRCTHLPAFVVKDHECTYVRRTRRNFLKRDLINLVSRICSCMAFAIQPPLVRSYKSILLSFTQKCESKLPNFFVPSAVHCCATFTRGDCQIPHVPLSTVSKFSRIF